MQPLSRGIFDIRVIDQQSINDFKTLLCSPGLRSPCGLKHLPYGIDDTNVAYNSPANFTVWNSHNRSYVTWFGAKVHKPQPAISEETKPDNLPILEVTKHITFLTEKQLKDQLAVNKNFTSPDSLLRIQQGLAHITPDAEVYNIESLKNEYGISELRVSHGKIIDTRATQSKSSTSQKTEPSTSTTPLSTSFEHLCAITGIEDDKDTPTHAVCPRVPIHSVRVTYSTRDLTYSTQLFQNNGFTTSLLSGLNTREKIHTLLIPVIESMLIPATSLLDQDYDPTCLFDQQILARDYVGQHLMSFMRDNYCSWLDTSLFLKLLLYCYPSQSDAFWLDKHDVQFVRNRDTRSHLGEGNRAGGNNLQMVWKAYDAKEKDGVKPYPINTMLDSWAAIPVTAKQLCSFVLREYIMAMCCSEVWTGRSSYMWTALHNAIDDNKKQYTTYWTSMPAAHNVFIPGVQNVMLVLVEEECQSAKYNLPELGTYTVYRGSRWASVKMDTFKATYIKEVSEKIFDLTSSYDNYNNSTQRACKLLRELQVNPCHDGAFRTATAMASELCSVANKTPFLASEGAGTSFGNTLHGGWGMGAGTLPNTSYVVKDIWEKGDAKTATTIARAMEGYNFAAVTPCGRIPGGYAKLSAENFVDDKNKFKMAMTYWTDLRPERFSDEYTVHTSSSTYRVIIGMVLMQTKLMPYHIYSTCGLQNTLTTNAIVQTLTLLRALAFNDIGLRQWYGFESAETLDASDFIGRLMRDWTFNIFRIPNCNVLRQRNVSDAIQAYYSQTWTDYSWGHTYPIPCFSLESWNHFYENKFNTQFPTFYEYISKDVCGLVLTVNGSYKNGQHLASATLNSLDHTPVTHEIIGGIKCHTHTLDIEQWSYIQSMGWQVVNKVNYFTSNVMLLSERYNYFQVSSSSVIRVENDKLSDGNKYHAGYVFANHPMRYPDPRNFLHQRTLSTTPSENSPGKPKVDGSKNNATNL